MDASFVLQVTNNSGIVEIFTESKENCFRFETVAIIVGVPRATTELSEEREVAGAMADKFNFTKSRKYTFR